MRQTMWFSQQDVLAEGPADPGLARHIWNFSDPCWSLGVVEGVVVPACFTSVAKLVMVKMGRFSDMLVIILQGHVLWGLD